MLLSNTLLLLNQNNPAAVGLILIGIDNNNKVCFKWIFANSFSYSHVVNTICFIQTDIKHYHLCCYSISLHSNLFENVLVILCFSGHIMH